MGKKRNIRFRRNERIIDQVNALAARHRSENIDRLTRRMTPQFYAATAVTLHRTFGFGQQRILRVFEDVRALWEEYEGRGDELVNLCRDETGVEFMYNAPEEGD